MRARRGAELALLLLLGCVALAPAAARGADGTTVAGIGVFGLRPSDQHVPLLDLEYRFQPWRHTFGVGPVVGAAVTAKGGGYARAGLQRDFELGSRWSANLGLAACIYAAGSGKRLGLPLEFRSALDLSYRVTADWRVGLAVTHLSNASFAEHNPGVETLAVTVAWAW